jgi:hypothetical protein
MSADIYDAIIDVRNELRRANRIKLLELLTSKGARISDSTMTVLETEAAALGLMVRKDS